MCVMHTTLYSTRMRHWGQIGYGKGSGCLEFCDCVDEATIGSFNAGGDGPEGELIADEPVACYVLREYPLECLVFPTALTRCLIARTIAQTEQVMTDMPLMDPSLSISHRRLGGWLLRHFYNMGNGIRAVTSVLAAAVALNLSARTSLGLMTIWTQRFEDCGTTASLLWYTTALLLGCKTPRTESDGDVGSRSQ